MTTAVIPAFVFYLSEEEPSDLRDVPVSVYMVNPTTGEILDKQTVHFDALRSGLPQWGRAYTDTEVARSYPWVLEVLG